jgi:hypothetical protein
LFSWHGHHEAPTNQHEASASQENLVYNADLLDRQISWEKGLLSDTETLAFFQELVDTGIAWKATGPVRRTAALLIREGQIHKQLNPGVEFRRPAFPTEESETSAKHTAAD